MISNQAVVSNKAEFGKNVQIGPFTIVHDNVIIGDNCIIESYCEIGVKSSLSNGEPLYIGHNSHIRSHSIFYEGSVFGDNLITGHRVTVRENTQSGSNVQIGTLSDIQGHCILGNYVKMHSSVHIGQKSCIGNYVWLFPYVVLTNDPHPPSNYLNGVQIKDYAVIATMAVLLPGALIEKDCLVAAHSCLKGNTKSGFIYAGSPAKPKGQVSNIKLQGTDIPAYPWRKHFHRGYTDEVLNEWLREFGSEDIKGTSDGHD